MKDADRLTKYLERSLAAADREAVRDQARNRRRRREAIEADRERDGLPALSMSAAQRRDLPTFQGRPCARGHDGVREARNGECVICRAADKSIRSAMRRGAYPENLTADERDRIAALYTESSRRTRRTGIPHHVDHRKPLAAGGRHHPDNLQIMTATENLKKGAKWDGDAPEPAPGSPSTLGRLARRVLRFLRGGL
jgi:5-methylcytosine-specific restriction endonuclease McrA